jgi:hypothetical protein
VAGSIRLDRPWRALVADEIDRLDGSLGVYQLADDSGAVRYIGYAGGRSLFGLRGELRDRLDAGGAASQFRVEVNMQYMSRYEELLMVHIADHGELPPDNDDRRRLGRLSPG